MWRCCGATMAAYLVELPMVASFAAPQTPLEGLDAALRERGFAVLSAAGVARPATLRVRATTGHKQPSH